MHHTLIAIAAVDGTWTCVDSSNGFSTATGPSPKIPIKCDFLLIFIEQFDYGPMNAGSSQCTSSICLSACLPTAPLPHGDSHMCMPAQATPPPRRTGTGSRGGGDRHQRPPPPRHQRRFSPAADPAGAGSTSASAGRRRISTHPAASALQRSSSAGLHPRKPPPRHPDVTTTTTMTPRAGISPTAPRGVMAGRRPARGRDSSSLLWSRMRTA